MSETLNAVDTALLETIADMKDGSAKGAVNIRKDSGCASRMTTENIDIRTKEDKPGIDIIVKAGCKNEVCHAVELCSRFAFRMCFSRDIAIRYITHAAIKISCRKRC